MKPGRIDTSGAASPLANTPFAGLSAEGLRPGGAPPPPASARDVRPRPTRERGRVDVVRQTAGRGGKTVTVLSGFKGIGPGELQELARSIQRACGVGGTLKAGVIEIQGDQRERAIEVLAAAGFRPVRAGG